MESLHLCGGQPHKMQARCSHTFPAYGECLTCVIAESIHSSSNKLWQIRHESLVLTLQVLSAPMGPISGHRRMTL